jgi:hypothetical protein
MKSALQSLRVAFYWLLTATLVGVPMIFLAFGTSFLRSTGATFSLHNFYADGTLAGFALSLVGGATFDYLQPGFWKIRRVYSSWLCLGITAAILALVIIMETLASISDAPDSLRDPLVERLQAIQQPLICLALFIAFVVKASAYYFEERQEATL